MAQDIPGVKKGAGILRAKLNVHWKKDRGKEPVREQSQTPGFGEAASSQGSGSTTFTSLSPKSGRRVTAQGKDMKKQYYTFAQFWKCALQVNPHAYSAKYRGKDHGMDANTYAEALRDECLAETIQVIGLADHGSVADAEIMRKVLVDAGIVVFPGFEVATTEKVHWVCLFPEDVNEQKLERYLGSLSLTNPGDGVRPSNLGGQQLLQRVEDLGGFCFAAHATSNSGLLRGKFNNLWADTRLRAAQVPGKIDDLPQEYKPIALNKNLDYKRDHPVALINAKDVVKPDDLRDPGASTFIKMTRPCFASFLMAFKDPESRVRLSDDLQERFYSQIDSISIEGGYFDGLSAKVSGHLNTVIGGRGHRQVHFAGVLAVRDGRPPQK